MEFSTQFRVLLLLLVSLCIPARADYIRTFDAEIRLNHDSSFLVSETIQVDFQNSQRHGIFRFIPVRYKRNGGWYTIYLKVLEVTDLSGRALPYSQTRQGNDLNLKIGSGDVTVTGIQTYRMKYLVRRAMNWFDGSPELYWNVTGSEWPYLVQSATATLILPSDIAVSNVRSKSYQGPPGSTVPAQITTQTDRIVFSATNLAAASNLTIVAGLPAGSLQRPSALQSFLWIFADWWPAFIFPLIALSLLTNKYLKSGRDIEGGQAVAVEWNPPKDLTPAEVGTLVDEHCDMQDIVSTLVDLAARGYLTIEETKTEKFLFLSSKDYNFTRLAGHNDPTVALLPHESKFLAGVFGSADPQDGSGTVSLSSLKNHFYSHLAGIRASIYASLCEKKMFNANPETVRTTYIGGGIFLLVAGVMVAVMAAAYGLTAYGVGLALVGLVVVAFSKAMPSKTATGSRALRECLGFQRFVRLAEKERIAVLAKEDPTVFGRLLPYAMVLGVADQWAFAFKDLMSEPPDWYRPYGYGTGYMFASDRFVHDLGGGMNTMGSTFSSQPQSTGGSGGSGFSSGGGSGGGFGGGGGGSW